MLEHLYCTELVVQLLHPVTAYADYRVAEPPKLKNFDPSTGKKVCTRCREYKTLGEFSHWKESGRYAAQCKECCKERSRYHAAGNRKAKQRREAMKCQTK